MANGKRSSTCKGKRRHRTTDNAKKHMDWLVVSGKARSELHIYRCPYCQSYHVGSKEPKTPIEFVNELKEIGVTLNKAVAGRDYQSATRAKAYKEGLERGLYLYQIVAGDRYREVQEARRWARYYKAKYDAMVSNEKLIITRKEYDQLLSAFSLQEIRAGRATFVDRGARDPAFPQVGDDPNAPQTTW